MDLVDRLSVGPVRGPGDTNGGRWSPTLARFGTVILLAWLYPRVSHFLAIPNIFAALIGYLIGDLVRLWYPPRKEHPPGKIPTALVLIGTLVAINLPYLVLYLESGGGDAPQGFLSFLAYAVANQRVEVWNDETGSFEVFRGFAAFLLHTLLLWTTALLVAMWAYLPPNPKE